MITVRTIDIRNDFKKISNIIKTGEKVVVARPHNDNLVVLSEKEYNELEKARRNADYLAMIDKSMQELADGKVVIKTMDELEEMAK
jgi:antitoxin YefM